MQSSGAQQQQILTTLNSARSYPDPFKPRITRDITNLMLQCNSLQCKVGTLVQSDGRQHTLAHLAGTVPIFYHDTQYNIPIAIWIPSGYPKVPPTCYVTPTKDMRIKPKHKHVDMQGMVYLPYLSQWNEQSSLVELLTFMSSVFSEAPPVFKASAPAAVQPPPPHYAPHPQPQIQPQPSQPKPPSEADLRAARKNELVALVSARLHRGLSHRTQQHRTLTTALQSEENMLKERQTVLQQRLDKAKEEQAHLVQTSAQLQQQSQQLEQWLNQHENTNVDIDVDSVVYARDTWSQQLLEAVAEDHAIEDTLYVLDRSLQNDRMDLETFLKETRKLARKQFFARAVSLRIHEQQMHMGQQPEPIVFASNSSASASVPVPMDLDRHRRMYSDSSSAMSMSAASSPVSVLPSPPTMSVSAPLPSASASSTAPPSYSYSPYSAAAASSSAFASSSSMYPGQYAHHNPHLSASSSPVSSPSSIASSPMYQPPAPSYARPMYHSPPPNANVAPVVSSSSISSSSSSSSSSSNKQRTPMLL